MYYFLINKVGKLKDWRLVLIRSQSSKENIPLKLYFYNLIIVTLYVKFVYDIGSNEFCHDVYIKVSY